MMNIKKSLHSNLKTCISSIETFDLDAYTDSSCAPFYSSVGSHFRHIIEVYQEAFRGFEKPTVDLRNRPRQIELSMDPNKSIVALEAMINQLKTIPLETFERRVSVSDDLGIGEVEVENSMAGLMMQAISHSIHHFSMIKQIAHSLKYAEQLEDGFGYNPTTPRTK